MQLKTKVQTKSNFDNLGKKVKQLGKGYLIYYQI